MKERVQRHCIAFEGTSRIAAGELPHVAAKTKEVIDRGERAPVLIFDDVTSHPVEIDFRGSVADVLRRLPSLATPPQAATQSEDVPSEGPRGPGRPKLGVVAREVTLLPRHWDWLSSQPGGASVALRKLVEEAKRTSAGKDRRRLAQESAYRFLSAMAGNLPGFEEATRALFAGNKDRFDEQVEPWPADVRDHAKKLVAAAMTKDD